MPKRPNRRYFSLSFPNDEAKVVIQAAEERGVSITLLFRMLVRKELMENPIRLEKQQMEA